MDYETILIDNMDINYTLTENYYHPAEFKGCSRKVIIGENIVNGISRIRMKITEVGARRLLIPDHVVEQKPDVLFVYNFTRSFEEMIKKDKPLVFDIIGVGVDDRAKIRLNKKWELFIGDILDTLAIMHKKNYHHGFLNNWKSYVMVEDELYLTTFGQRDWGELEDQTRSCEDVKEFGKFLTGIYGLDYLLPQEITSKDLTHFLKAFKYATACEMRKHPFLLDNESKVHQLRGIIDDAAKQDPVYQRAWKEKLKIELKEFSNWTTMIGKNNVFKAIQKYNKGGDDFMIFLKQVVEHYSEQYKKIYKGEPKMCQVGEQISLTFPGAQAIIFEVLVFHLKNGKVLEHFP